MIIRPPWTRQPQYPTPVDTGFARPFLLVVPQLKSDPRLSIAGGDGTMPTVATKYGVAFCNGLYGDNPSLGTAAGFLTDSAGAGSNANVNKSFSISFVVTSNTEVEGLASSASTALSATSSFIIQNNAGTIRVYNGTFWTDMGPVVFDKLHTVSWSYEDFSPYTFRMYFDGDYKGSTTGYRNDWDAYPLWIGSGFGNNLCMANARILQALLVQGAHTDLSHDWHRTYGLNPFRLFQTLPRRLWVPSAAAVAIAPRPMALTQARNRAASY